MEAFKYPNTYKLKIWLNTLLDIGEFEARVSCQDFFFPTQA